jgi:hypothetical protein
MEVKLCSEKFNLSLTITKNYQYDRLFPTAVTVTLITMTELEWNIKLNKLNVRNRDN